MTRPALRYHGGKWLLAPWIIKHFPPHRVYVELFGGGASVLLRKPRSYAEVYNDLDGEVVNVFRQLRDNGQELLRILKFTPFAREEYELARQPTDEPLERARRTVVRSFMGFGSDSIKHTASGFRANSNRSGTTPAHDWANYSEALPLLIEFNYGNDGTVPARFSLEVLLKTVETWHGNRRDSGTSASDAALVCVLVGAYRVEQLRELVAQQRPADFTVFELRKRGYTPKLAEFSYRELVGQGLGRGVEVRDGAEAPQQSKRARGSHMAKGASKLAAEPLGSREPVGEYRPA